MTAFRRFIILLSCLLLGLSASVFVAGCDGDVDDDDSLSTVSGDDERRDEYIDAAADLEVLKDELTEK